MRALALLAALLLFGGAVQAQTTGLNPAALIAHYESSGNPTAQSPVPGNTSSGLYGFTNGTWQTYAQQLGVNVQQYPSAYLAPSNVQTAVFYQDFNQRGFADWTCNSCDPAAAAAIQAAGGTSAFAQGSTNPADYASLNTPSGLQAYFSGAGTQPAGTAGTGGTVPSLNVGTVNVTSSTSPPFAPFTWLWNQYQTGMVASINAVVGQMQNMAQGPLTGAATLSLVVILIAAMYHWYPIERLFRWLIRISFVIPFVAVGSSLYQTYVEGFFLQGIPAWIAQGLSPVSGMANVSAVTGPAAIFDNAAYWVWTHVLEIWQQIPTDLRGLLEAIILAACALFMAAVLVVGFAIFLLVQALLAIVVCLGPILALFVLFDYTLPIFHRWIGMLVGLSIATLAVNITIDFFLNIVALAMGSFNTTASAEAQLLSLLGVSMITGVLVFAIYELPGIVQFIGGAVGVPSVASGRQVAAAAFRAPTSMAQAAFQPIGGTVRRVPGDGGMTSRGPL